MIAVTEIAGYVPDGRLSNFDRQRDFGIDESFIVNKLGVRSVSRIGAAAETSDLCVAAFGRLQAGEVLRSQGIQCLVVCTQNPDGHGIPHTAAVVHGKLGLPESCAAFDLSLGCSGYVYGLSVVQAFMQANGMARGVFFTADPYSKILDSNDKNTALLFGDAATATVLRADAEREEGWRAQSFVFATRGEEGGALHNRSGRLEMNGRAIFNFAATAVPKQVHECLDRAKLRLEDIDLFVFHQGSKYILDTLQRRMKLPPEKVAIDLSEHGNTVSSSIPLVLAKRLDEPRLARVLLCGFGVGLSWAACVLQRRR